VRYRDDVPDVRANTGLLLPYLLFPLVVVALVGTHGTDAHNAVASGTFLALNLAGALYARKAAMHPALTRAQRRPWWLVMGCFGALWTASVGFGIYAVTDDDRMPLPHVLSLGGRLAFVLVLLVALLMFAAEPLTGRAGWKLAMDVTAVIGAGVMLFWYFLVGPAITDPQAETAQLIVPVSDLVLILGVCAMMLRGAVRGGRRPLNLVFAGTLSYLVVDFYLTLGDGPVLGGHWLASVLIPVPLFFLLAATIEQIRQAGRPARPTPLRNPRGTGLPYLALLLGYGVLAYAAWSAGVAYWYGLVVGGVVMTVGVTVRQILAFRENETMMVTDRLTGVANRMRLREALARSARRAARDGRPVGVLLLDLDGFKQVNDVYGHDAGDQALIMFASVLNRNLRGGDLVARLGGDEFAVLLDGVDDVAAATAVADRILAQLTTPITLAGVEKTLRASIGIALSAFPDGAGPAAERDLLHCADVAMYVAKRRRTHGWQVYVEGSMELGRELAVLGDELGTAVTDGELRVEYQPIVALSSGDLAGVEALARWHHPTRGIVPPATFIPLAEETGHIHEIGAWVLEEALTQVKRWQDRLPGGRGLYLSVNVSAFQLERPRFAAEVCEVLDRVGFHPAHLVLEVTESALVNEAAALTHLTELRARGVRVAVDDFGTGYSSLRYLSRLPVDILKIDRSFVAELNGDPAGAAVAEAVIRLGQILKLDTVAEGIEQPAQAVELTELGCDNAQGYHFAEPLAVDAMEALVARASEEWPSLPEQRVSSV
jgi:diguanylate cyclase (GGDEF)-like protein